MYYQYVQFVVVEGYKYSVHLGIKFNEFVNEIENGLAVTVKRFKRRAFHLVQLMVQVSKISIATENMHFLPLES